MTTLESLWNFVLAGSLRASALIAAIFILRGLTRRWLPAQCFHLLWLLVAVKLLVPFAPASSWSAFNLKHRVPPARVDASEPAWRVTLSDAPAVASAPAGVQARAVAEPATAVVVRPGDRRWIALPLVWLGGVLIQCGLLARALWRMRSALRRSATSADPRVLAMARDGMAAIGLRSAPRILESEAVSGPAVVGLLRPCLLLPRGLADAISDTELRWVLLHEFAHLRRRDLVCLWLMTLARTVHWFNPLVWLAARCSRLDTELACDATVLRATDASAGETYGAALLRLAQSATWQPTAVPAAGIVESKRALRERLRRIASFQPGGSRQVAASAAVVLAVALAFGADEVAPAAIPPEAAPANAAPPTDPAFAKGWTVTMLSLSQRDRRPVHFVRIRRADGGEFNLFSTGASNGGVVLDRVDWTDASRPRVFLRKGDAVAVLNFPATPAAASASRAFGEGWKVVGISQPAPDNVGGVEVDLETDYGATLTLSTEHVSHDGFTVHVTEPEDTAQPLVAVINRGTDRAQFTVDRRLVVERASDPGARPQIEIEAKFIEIGKDALAKMDAEALRWLKPVNATEIDKRLFGPISDEQRAASEWAGGGIAGILNEQQLAPFLAAMNKQTGTDLLSAPRVTTRSGQRAVIEIIREFRYPTDWERDDKNGGVWTPTAFETRNTGVTLEVEPTLGPDGYTIDLNLTPQVVEFLGFVDFVTRQAVAAPAPAQKSVVAPGSEEASKIIARQRQVPIFSARKTSASVSIFDGQTIVFGALPETEQTAPFKSKAADSQLVVVITARRVTRDGQPFNTPASTAANGSGSGSAAGKPPGEKPAPAGPATALPVAGKPGFVRSPHAPEAGYIDVRGFPPGTEVKCPYSGKTFLIP